MQKRMKSSYFKATGILMIFFTISCVPTHKLNYFNDIKDLELPEVNPRTQKLILPFDKLYIKVFSTDFQTSQIFNNSDEMGYGNTNSVIGYLVDEAGNINFPFVGNIKVVSLTTAQASEKIQKAMSDYVPNTSIVVKFIDNKVTIVGEVQSREFILLHRINSTFMKPLDLEADLPDMVTGKVLFSSGMKAPRLCITG